MTIGALIALLQKLQKEHGNLPVYVRDYEYGSDDEVVAKELVYRPAEKEGNHAYPDRFVFGVSIHDDSGW